MSTQATPCLAPTSARLQPHDRPRPHARSVVPVLIRVPSLSSRSRKPVRPAVGRARRRLRSEVRVASLTLVFALPMSWALFTLVQAGPAGAVEPSRAVAIAPPVDLQDATPIDDSPVATIGLTFSGPAAAQPPAPAAPDSEGPTVIPSGFLVPDEGPEETVHAGP